MLIDKDDPSDDAYALKTFSYTSNADYKPLFVFTETSSNGYTSNYNSSCTLEFTRIETFKGGKVEGVFSFLNVDLIDKDANVISSNHTLTDGKFSFTVQ